MEPATAAAVASAAASIKSIFGGGGQGQAAVSGYRISGVATPGGFDGLVAGLGRHGSGAPYIDEAGAWGERRQLGDDIRVYWERHLSGRTEPVPITFDAPYSWAAVTAQVEAALKAAARPAPLFAPAQAAVAPSAPSSPSSPLVALPPPPSSAFTGSSIMPAMVKTQTNGASPGGSIAQRNAQAAQAPAVADLGPVIALAVLAAVVWTLVDADG